MLYNDPVAFYVSEKQRQEYPPLETDALFNLFCEEACSCVSIFADETEFLAYINRSHFCDEFGGFTLDAGVNRELIKAASEFPWFDEAIANLRANHYVVEAVFVEDVHNVAGFKLISE